MSIHLGCAHADLIRAGFSPAMTEIWRRLCLLVNTDDLTALSSQDDTLGAGPYRAPGGGDALAQLLAEAEVYRAPASGGVDLGGGAELAALRAQIARLADRVETSEQDNAGLRRKVIELEKLVCLTSV